MNRAASNPVLIGAVTVLVATVAVFLAYNANHGLPFVPTTTVKVRVANGANLVEGNEVRSGGSRIGVVTAMRPVRLEDGSTGAELTLELDRAHGDLPKDSTLRIRPRSALGLKYVEVTKGTSRENFRSGDTVPSSQAAAATEFDEVFGAPCLRRRVRLDQTDQAAGHGREDGMDQSAHLDPSRREDAERHRRTLDDRRRAAERALPEGVHTEVSAAGRRDCRRGIPCEGRVAQG